MLDDEQHEYEVSVSEELHRVFYLMAASLGCVSCVKCSTNLQNLAATHGARWTQASPREMTEKTRGEVAKFRDVLSKSSASDSTVQQRLLDLRGKSIGATHAIATLTHAQTTSAR